MTIIPHILNLATMLCGLAIASMAFNPQATPGVKVFWAVIGALCVLRGIL